MPDNRARVAAPHRSKMIERAREGRGGALSNGRLLAWHFTGYSWLRDGRPVPPIGEWLEHTGPVNICRSGLHASERILDALEYARGPLIHRVELDGVVERQLGKVVARRRRILWTVRGERLLCTFAAESAGFSCWCAGMSGDAFERAVEATAAFSAGDTGIGVLRGRWRVARDSAVPFTIDASGRVRANVWDAIWSASWACAFDWPWSTACRASHHAARAAERAGVQAPTNARLTELVEDEHGRV